MPSVKMLPPGGEGAGGGRASISTDLALGIQKRPEKIHSLLFCVDDRLRRVVQDVAFVVTVLPSFLYILLRPLQKKLLKFQKVVL